MALLAQSSRDQTSHHLEHELVQEEQASSAISAADSNNRDSAVRADSVLHLTGNLEAEVTHLLTVMARARAMHLRTVMAGANLLMAKASHHTAMALLITGED